MHVCWFAVYSTVRTHSHEIVHKFSRRENSSSPWNEPEILHRFIIRKKAHQWNNANQFRVSISLSLARSLSNDNQINCLFSPFKWVHSFYANAIFSMIHMYIYFLWLINYSLFLSVYRLVFLSGLTIFLPNIFFFASSSSFFLLLHSSHFLCLHVAFYEIHSDMHYLFISVP